MAEWKQGKVGEEADCSEVIAAARWIAEETGEPVSLDQITATLKESFKTIPRRDIELRVIVCMDKMHRQGLAVRLPRKSNEHDLILRDQAGQVRRLGASPRPLTPRWWGGAPTLTASKILW